MKGKAMSVFVQHFIYSQHLAQSLICVCVYLMPNK